MSQQQSRSLFLFFWWRVTRNWTWGLACAKQVFYHWTIPSPLFLFFRDKISFIPGWPCACYKAEGDFVLLILLPPAPECLNGRSISPGLFFVLSKSSTNDTNMVARFFWSVLTTIYIVKKHPRMKLTFSNYLSICCLITERQKDWVSDIFIENKWLGDAELEVQFPSYH